MSYARFSTDPKWYVWWDGSSGPTRDTQVCCVSAAGFREEWFVSPSESAEAAARRICLACGSSDDERARLVGHLESWMRDVEGEFGGR